MAERKRTDDFHELCALAIEAIAKALDDGNEKHSPGSWMNESYAEQTDHMTKHLNLVRLEADGAAQFPDEDHLAHLICRGVIAYALRERKR